MKKGNYGKRRIVYTRLFVSNGQSVGDTMFVVLCATSVHRNPILLLWRASKNNEYEWQGNTSFLFYTDDYRFRSIYEKPEKILKYNPGSIIEPNFSLSNDTPIAFGMQAIYKKRFLARAMQEKGIGVFVDLNVAPKFYKLNLMGIPKGYSSFATRGCTDRLNELQFEYEIAKFVANGNRFRFIVYGGGNVIEQWCKENNAVYITPIIIIKNKLKAFEKMKDTIGMLDVDAKEKYQELKKTLYDTQVKNFSIEDMLDNMQDFPKLSK